MESRQHWRAARSVVLLITGLALLWLIADALLLVFAAILLAILLRTLSGGLARMTGLPEGPALAITCLGLVALIGGLGWLFVPQIAEQLDQLRDALPKAWDQIRSQVERYGWAQGLLEGAPPVEQVLSGTGKVFSRITGAVSGTIGALANFFLIVVLALFLAADPEVYKRGLLRLFPLERRERMQQIYKQLGEALRHWLIGQLAAMAIIGILTGIGLAILGIPMALALVVLVVLLNFIPNLGPLIALAPAVLLALSQGWQDALWVVALYLGSQTVEGNFLTPMIQQRAVNIPPALTIASQLVFGLLFGFLGVALATPLAVAVMVLVKTLYMEDHLGDFVQ